MKKKVLLIVTGVLLGGLLACSNPAEEAADVIIDMNDTVDDAENVLEDYRQTMQDVDDMGQNVLDGNTDAPAEITP